MTLRLNRLPNTHEPADPPWGPPLFVYWGILQAFLQICGRGPVGACTPSDAASAAALGSLAGPLVGSWAGRRARKHAPTIRAMSCGGQRCGQHALQSKPKKPAFPAYSLRGCRIGARISTRSGIT